MPLSDDDKRRIEEEEQYRRELAAAAKAEEDAEKAKAIERKRVERGLLGCLVTVVTALIIGVVWLLRWLGWMAPAAT